MTSEMQLATVELRFFDLVRPWAVAFSRIAQKYITLCFATQTDCKVHRLGVEIVERILLKSVGVLFDRLFAELRYRDAVGESVRTVNSVCRAWWNVVTERTSNKRCLRRLLDRKLSSSVAEHQLRIKLIPFSLSKLGNIVHVDKNRWNVRTIFF